MKRKIYLISITLLFCFFFNNNSKASFQKKLINKYKTINTFSFDFTQTIGDKVEFGNCYIKYPLLMRCEYPKKKKSIITNGKKLAIVKRRYKKIYNYPLKKTPLFYLLKKENIINLIENDKSTLIDSKIIEYKYTDSNSNKIKVFFDKVSLNLLGWKTLDAYSNEVSFLIRNVEINILVKDKFFKIPKEEDL